MDRLALLTSYLKDSPDDPFLHFALAQEYGNQEKISEAVTEYEYLMKEHSDYVGTYYHAGQAYEKLGNLNKALEIYDLGIEIARQAKDRHSASELEGVKALLLDRM